MPVLSHRIPETRHRAGQHPLGRHFKWDTRNDAYIYRRGVIRAAGQTLHARHIPILDQGNASSCTAEAETGACGTDPLFATMPTTVTLDQPFAYAMYSKEQQEEGYGPYPPADNGGTGLDISKVFQTAGLISGYQHALNVNDMAAALQTVPVIIGINWYTSFDSPNSSGVIQIGSGASVRGGHEVLVRGVDASAGIFFADNSWGTSWGANGSFQIPFAVMSRLFSEGGDCTVPVPLSSPAPVPSPVPAVATAADRALDSVAGPWAQGTRIRSDLVRLKAAIQAWEQASGLA